MYVPIIFTADSFPYRFYEKLVISLTFFRPFLIDICLEIKYNSWETFDAPLENKIIFIEMWVTFLDEL